MTGGTRTRWGALLGLWAVSAAGAAPKVLPPASTLVQPVNFVLDGKWASQQIVVEGRAADGSLSDLTARAQFKSASGKIASVGKAGVVTPVGDGETTIQVSAPGFKTKVFVTVKNARGTAASFTNQVRPLLAKLGCNATQCHGAGKGKGGLKLSLFGGDPDSDYEALTKSAEGRRVNRVEPMKSLLLAKATGQAPHQGGAVLKAGTPEHEMIVAWLRGGAPLAGAKEPLVVGLKVFPEGRVMRKGETQQLLATVVFSDGSQRDVTGAATFKSADARVGTAGPGGKLTAAGFGETYVVASYLRQAAVVRVTVPQPLAAPFPKLEATRRIDELVWAKLKLLGIPPSGECTDEQFLRRAYLDVIGLLPTAAETRAFLADKDPARRARLIDRLLERPEFADFWSLKWGDLLRIKSEYPVRVWPKAVAVYYRWVHESIARNQPYDQFVREMLLSGGSNFRNGPANFFRANASKDARSIGETTALVFMGARIGCARCHGHPTENWTLEDDLGMGAFFAKVNFKSTMEWKEEIVYSDLRGTLRHPKTRDAVKPKFLGGAAPDLEREEDPRAKFADWLTSPQNPWFARNIANRIWFWLLGAGIVNEPDDLRPTNPPSNPELLEYLEREVTSHNYDLRHLYRLILNSRTYQLSSVPNRFNVADTRFFSHYPVKRMGAEQLLDAISQVTETSERFRSIIPEPYSNWPMGYRATQISDGNTECSFLDMFGRPTRDTPYEEERSSEPSLRQSLYFINSEQLDGKVSGSPSLRRLLQSTKDDAAAVEELYLMTLSRFPSAEEKKKLLEYLAKKKSARPQAVQDVLWAMLNAKEFMFIH